MMLGKHLIKSWGSTQGLVSLSSGEVEYYGLVTGCAEGLGAQALAEDMGYDVEVRVWTDSNAGRSVASRRGLGKMRHVELKHLWVQETVKDGRLEVRRVNGERNIADHLTKAKSGAEMAEMIREAGGEMVHNRGLKRTAQSLMRETVMPRLRS